MNSLTILDQITIASPCPAEWSEMTGDDRTRFCGSCSKHVYNIAAMTAEEATNLIIATEGNLCARIYRRQDGTILTADCPVGRQKITAGRRFRRVLAAGLILPALAVAGVAARGFSTRQVDPFPTGPGTTWNDRIDWALITLGVKERTVFYMGFYDAPTLQTAFPVDEWTPVLPLPPLPAAGSTPFDLEPTPGPGVNR